MRLGVALVVLASCLLAGGCSLEIPDQFDRLTGQDGKARKERNAPDEQHRIRSYSVGDAADFGDYSLTINDLYKTDGSEFGGDYRDSLEPDEVYVILDASFESNSDTARQVFFRQGAEMYDAGGYDVPTGTLPEIGGGPQGTLLPGRKLSGEEVYVAKKDSDLTLIYNPRNEQGGFAPATFELGSVSDIPEREVATAPETENTPSPEPVEQEDLAVGDTAITESGNEITVLTYESPVPPSDFLQPEPGYEYSAIEVKECAGPDIRGSLDVNSFNYSLQMPDDTFIAADIDIREPALPLVALQPGDCARGWVTFQTPEGQVPKYVIHDATFDPTKWAVQSVEVLDSSTEEGPLSSTDTSGDEETAVEDAVRGHYEAIGDGDFDRAYSYFGPTFRSQQTQESWVAGEESFDIRGSTINSLDVTYVDDTTATATVDVSFQDNTGNPRFLITWNLLKENGEWKLDDQVSAEKLE